MRAKLLLPLVLGIATLGAASYGQSLLSAFRTPAQQKEANAKGQIRVINTQQKATQDFSGKALRTNRRNVDARPNVADYPVIYGLKHADSGYNDVSGDSPDAT